MIDEGVVGLRGGWIILFTVAAGPLAAADRFRATSAGGEATPAPGREEVHHPSSLRAAIALQIALENRGYSPGLIDGKLGPKTRFALAAFQAGTGLPASGEADAATLRLLAPDPDQALTTTAIEPADLQEVAPPARDWIERSRRRRLLYPSLANLVAERAHTTERLLSALNPDRDLMALGAGDTLVVPAANGSRRPAAPVERIEIDLERKAVLLFSGSAVRPAPAGILFCSIASDPEKAPVGETCVATVVADPIYTFDPAKWPEVRGVERKLQIPPGPRSPVGIRWIGLKLEGIGIHGAPEPELIGKTGSHGCFRLTNWDAAWLASLVQPGTPVRIVRTTRESSWSWAGI